jgi:hypothetical protein
MAIQTYEFLNKASVKTLASQIFAKSIIRIDERIVNDIDANSSDKQVVSARALYDLVAAIQAADKGISDRIDANVELIAAQEEAIGELQEAKTGNADKLSDIETGIGDLSDAVDGLTHLTIQTVEGSISTVTSPASDVIYLQRDSAEDPSWMIYVYTANNGWVNVGDTELDLTKYWSKDDVTDMQEALGMHNVEALSDDDIIDAVDAAYNENPVEF